MQITKEQILTAGDGNQYKITVTYDSDAGIPEDAELQVSELTEGKEYDKYVEKAAKKLDRKPTQLNFAHAFDITLVNPETGEHYQPKKAVSVSVKLLTGEMEADDKVKVVHFGDETQLLNSRVNGKSIEFETDGFSVYLFAGYTVDFDWDGRLFSMEGGDEVLLSHLLERLSFTDRPVSEVKSVTFSNRKLVEIERTEDDWLLRSLKPFSTRERLNIRFEDDEVLSITVTDAQDPVCQIRRGGSVTGQYTSLQAAYNAAQNSGDVIEMLGDYALPDCVMLNKNKSVTITSESGSRTISRGWSTKFPGYGRFTYTRMFDLTAGSVTLKNIVISGRDLSQSNGNQDVQLSGVGNSGALFLMSAAKSSTTKPSLTLDSGAVLQYGYAKNNGGAVNMDCGELVMNSGSTIKNCIARYDNIEGVDNGGGGAVCVWPKESVYELLPWVASEGGGASFVMNGGTIERCEAQGFSGLVLNIYNNRSVGGGVFLNNGGTFTMNGGTIKKCKAYRKDTLVLTVYAGGAVAAADDARSEPGNHETWDDVAGTQHTTTFTMNGGVIENCEAPQSGGGAIAVDHYDKAVINGGVIRNCTAQHGDAIEVHGDLIMSGGLITNCGSSATGCENASGNKGAICFWSDLNSSHAGRLYLTNKADSKENDVKIYGNGARDITISDHLENKIHLEGDLSKDAIAYVYDSSPRSGSRFGTNANGTDKRFQRFKNDKYPMQLQGGHSGADKLVWASVTYACKIVRTYSYQGQTFYIEYPFETLADAKSFADTYMSGTATIQMLRNYEMPKDEAFDIGERKNYTITTASTDGDTALNGGYTYYKSTVNTAVITRKEDGESLFKVSGGTLNLGNITLDGGKKSGKQASGDGGLVNYASGTLTMGNETTLRNSETDGKGGAVYVAPGRTLNLNGAAISGCSADKGGAVYVGSGATVSTGAAKITGNSAENGGGAVYVDSRAVLNLNGGSITGNTTENGGAVNVEDDTARLNFSGNAKVSGNTSGGSACNVYLDRDSNEIICANNLGTGASIGVYVVDGQMDAHGSKAKPFGTIDAGSNLDKFVNDRNELTAEAGAGDNAGRVVWINPQAPLKEIYVKKVWKDTPENQRRPVRFTISAVKTGGEVRQVTAYSAAANGTPVTTLTGIEGNGESAPTEENGAVTWKRSVWVPSYLDADNDIQEYSIDEAELDVRKDESDTAIGVPGVWKPWDSTSAVYTAGTPQPAKTGYEVDDTVHEGNPIYLLIECNHPYKDIHSLRIYYKYTVNSVKNTYRTVVNLSSKMDFITGGKYAVKIDKFAFSYSKLKKIKNSVAKHTSITEDTNDAIDGTTNYTYQELTDTTWKLDSSYSGYTLLSTNNSTPYYSQIYTTKSASNPPATLTLTNTFLSNKILTVQSSFADNSADSASTNGITGVKYTVLDENGKLIPTDEVDKGEALRIYVPADRDYTVRQAYYILSDGTHVRADSGGVFNAYQTTKTTAHVTSAASGDTDTQLKGRSDGSDCSVTFTNTRRMGVTVKAEWDPTQSVTDSVAYTLNYGADPVSGIVTRSEGWTHTHDSVPTYSVDGTPVTCALNGQPLSNYNTVVERAPADDPADSITFTLKSTTQKGVLTIKKEWSIKGWPGMEVTTETPVTVTIRDEGGTVVKTLTITGDTAGESGSGDHWQKAVELPIGVKYTVSEAAVSGYTASYAHTYPTAAGLVTAQGDTLTQALTEDGAFFTITNEMDSVARVSTDGGATWTYYNCLLTEGAETGALDYAKTQSGAVIVELLKKNSPKYTLTEQVKLNSDSLTDLTIRTVPEASFQSTIKRGDGFDKSMFEMDKAMNLTLDDIILDGDSGNQTASAKGGIVYVNQAGANLTVGSGATLRNSSVGDDKEGGAIWLAANTSLTMDGTIENCEAKSGGAIYAEHSAEGSETVINIGGTIRDCTAAKEGGAVKASNYVTLNINNGADLSDNRAKHDGGAVYVSSTVNMTGGSITGSSAGKKGAALYLDNNGVLNMSGGSITDNAVDADTGAVEVGGTDARLNFSGEAHIYDNTYAAGEINQQRNVVLIGSGDEANEIIQVTGAFSDSERSIGVYDATATENHRNPGELFGSYGAGNSDHLDVFRNDIYPALVGMDAGNGKICWCTLKVEWYKYTDGGYGAAEYQGETTYYYDYSSNPGVDQPTSVDTVRAAVEGSVFIIPDGWEFETAVFGDAHDANPAVYGDIRNIAGLYPDGRMMVTVRKDKDSSGNGGTEEVLATTGKDANYKVLYKRGAVLKLYYYKTDKLMPVVVEKQWKGDAEQNALTEDSAVQFKVKSGSEEIGVYTDSRKADVATNTVIKDNKAIIGSSEEEKAWHRLLYVPEQSSYALEEPNVGDLPVQNPGEEAWSFTGSVNTNAKEWVEVEETNYEQGWIKLPGANRGSDFGKIQTLVLYFEGIDHIRYRSRVELKSDRYVDWADDKTCYIPVRLPKNVPYCSLLLFQSNGHVYSENNNYDNKENLYGITTFKTNGTKNEPRFTQKDVYDDLNPNSTGGPVVVQNVEFIHALPASTGDDTVREVADVASFSLKVLAQKHFTLENSIRNYPKVEVWKYEKGHFDEAQQLCSTSYPVETSDGFVSVETIILNLLSQNLYEVPEGYAYSDAMIGERHYVSHINANGKYQVAGSYNQGMELDIPQGEPLKIYYRKSDNLEPVLIQKRWADSVPDAQKNANLTVSYTADTPVYPSNVAVGSPTNLLDADNQVTISGTAAPVPWTALGWVSKKNSHSVTEDVSALKVVDGTGAENPDYGEWKATNPPYTSTSSKTEWVTVPADQCETVYLRVRRYEEKAQTFTQLLIMYRDSDGVAYESTSTFPTSSALSSSDDSFLQIQVPQNVDLNTLELFVNQTTVNIYANDREPKFNSLSSNSYGFWIDTRPPMFGQTGFYRGRPANQYYDRIAFLRQDDIPSGTASDNIRNASTMVVKVYTPKRLIIENTFRRKFTVTMDWTKADKSTLAATVQLYKVMGTATIEIPNYTTQIEANERVSGIEGFTVAPVSGGSCTMTSADADGTGIWTHTFENLDPDADYFAVVTSLTDNGQTTERFLPTYIYNQAKGKLEIINGDFIARVRSRADATAQWGDWTYHSYLVNSTGVGVELGAFDKAKTLSGEVEIETLRETAAFDGVNRFMLSNNESVNLFDNAGKVTLRTTQDERWNKTGFRSTIIRGSSNKKSMFTVGTGKSLTTEHIILDGGATLYPDTRWNNTSWGCNGAVSVSGGIINSDGSVTVGTKSTLQNSAIKDANHHGGAVYVSSSGNFDIQGEITHCISTGGNGGGAYVAKAVNLNETASATDLRASVSYCKSGFDQSGGTPGSGGGGIYIGTGDSATVHNINFDHCMADSKGNNDGGAGLYVAATVFEVENCDFKHNESRQKNAAGLFHFNKTAASKTTVSYCVFEDCKATGNSGGAMETGTQEVHISYSTFTDLYAKSNGGAINVYNEKATIEVTGCSFERCTAAGLLQNNDKSGNGGAVRNYGLSTTITNCTFKDCYAKRNGGAVASDYANGSLTISGASTRLEGCTTEQFGGGIYLAGGANSTLNFSDGTIDTCSAPNGGGVYQKDGTFNFESGTISGSKSTTSHGGGVYLNSGTFNLNGGTISGCEAEMQGGGLFLNGDNSTFNLNSGSITNSFAHDKGGGVYLNKGTFNMNGGTISQCYAVNFGGGAYMGGGKKFEMTDGSISNCCAPSGGGIYIGAALTQDVIISKNGDAITGCEARKVEIISDVATATDVPKSGNQGGGIYQNGGKLYVGTDTNGTIKRPGIHSCAAYEGGGIYLNQPSGKTSNLNLYGTVGNTDAAKKNTATNGGGIYQSGGTLNIHTGASVTGNEAGGGNGGGIYLGGGRMDIETGTSIQANKATPDENGADGNGGGIYLAQPAGTTSSLTLHGVIGGAESGEGNSAKNGGGIYQAGGTLTIGTGVSVTGNQADGGNGGGIYLGGGTLDLDGGTIGGTTAGTGNTAANGGGIYQGGGTLTIGTQNGTGGSVQGNVASPTSLTSDDGFGGGIYLGGGSFTLISGSIGVENDEENPQGLATGGNKARKGGGLFVGDGESDAEEKLTKAHIEGGVIGGNYATEVAGGGGIAIGGKNVRLYFSGNIQVWGNTMEPSTTYPLQTRCDVCLNVDSNDVIRTTSAGLVDDSHIGVYVPDEQVTEEGEHKGKWLHKDLHGTTDLPFGTFDSTELGDKCLNRFINNRSGYSGLAYQGYEYYYGVRKPEEEDPKHYIYWAKYICEITDEAGNLLFTNSKATAPALYQYLGKHGAFEALNNHTQLYKKRNVPYTGSKYCVRLLVFEYDLRWNETLTVPANVDVTLMMAKDDDNNLPAALRKPSVYHDIYHGCTTIKRGKCTSHPMFTTAAGSKFTIQSAIIDGGATFDESGACTGGQVGVDGALIKAGGDVTLGNKATLQNSVITKPGNDNHFGAAVWYYGPGTFKMGSGSKIQRCNAENNGGGAVLYVRAGESDIVNFAAPSEAGQISNCKAKNGLVYVRQGTLNLTGAFRGADDPADPGSSGAPTVVNIKDCKSKYGGLAYVNGGTLNLNGTVTRFKAAYTENDAEKDGDGGVAYVNNGGILNVGGTVSNCTAANGGAAYVNGSGTLNLNGTIQDCEASNGGNGGGVYVNKGHLKMMTDSAGIKYCTAGKGGAVFGSSAPDPNDANQLSIQISAGELSYNKATGYGGGAIRLEGGSKAEISGGTFTENSVEAQNYDKYGGAINVDKGSLTISGGTFSNNLVEGSGKPAFGGAIHVNGNKGYSSTLTISGGTFSGNKADATGGSVYGGAVSLRGPLASAEISGGTIADNTATTNNKDAFGGAIAVLEGASVTMSGGTVVCNSVKTGNSARKAQGPGIYLGYNKIDKTGSTAPDDIAPGTLKLSGSPSFGGTGIYSVGEGENQKQYLLALDDSKTVTKDVVDDNGAPVLDENDDPVKKTYTLYRRYYKKEVTSGTSTKTETVYPDNNGNTYYMWDEGKLYTVNSEANNPAAVDTNVIPGIGNFLTETLSGKKNGGKDYFQTREDIYIAGYAGESNNAESLMVTGKLTKSNSADSLDGSIWVGTEDSAHYKQNMQFATFAEDALDTDGKVKSAVGAENTMKAFRNAYDDETTENGTDSYLYGETGDGVYINWTGIKGTARVILKKVGSAYEPLEGAKFELYRGDAQIEWPGTSPTNLATSTDIGVLWIGDLPYGEYYLKETQAPTKPAGAATSPYAGNKDKWFCLIVDGTGVWMSEKGYTGKEAAKTDAEAVRTAGLPTT